MSLVDLRSGLNAAVLETLLIATFPEEFVIPALNFAPLSCALKTKAKPIATKFIPKDFKRESNFPCSLAQITPDNKQRFNTHSVSLSVLLMKEARVSKACNRGASRRKTYWHKDKARLTGTRNYTIKYYC